MQPGQPVTIQTLNKHLNKNLLSCKNLGRTENICTLKNLFVQVWSKLSKMWTVCRPYTSWRLKCRGGKSLANSIAEPNIQNKLWIHIRSSTRNLWKIKPVFKIWKVLKLKSKDSKVAKNRKDPCYNFSSYYQFKPILNTPNSYQLVSGYGCML